MAANRLDSWVPSMGGLIADRYRVDRLLGNGAMGVIMAAHDVEVDRPVALKFLHPRVASQHGYADRFRREAKLGTKLNHARIVRCYDFGETDRGVLYLSLELVEGQTLRALLEKEGCLGAHQIRNIALQVLDGLSTAHELDIVHRDLKPSNIMVTTNHRGELAVKLLDFGLARTLVDDETKITRTGKIVGTASYIAPESLVMQNTGKSGDVYAMGVIMLEMFTGRKPFQAPTVPETFLQHLVFPAQLPRRLWDSGIGQIVARSLEKYPPRRFGDAREMFETLEDVAPGQNFRLSGAEVPPPPPAELPRDALKQIMAGDKRIELLEPLPRPECWDGAVIDAESAQEMDATLLERVADPSTRETVAAPAVSADDTVSEISRPTALLAAVTGDETVVANSRALVGLDDGDATTEGMALDRRKLSESDIETKTRGRPTIPSVPPGELQSMDSADVMLLPDSGEATVEQRPTPSLGAERSDITTRESIIESALGPTDTQEHVDTVPKAALSRDRLEAALERETVTKERPNSAEMQQLRAQRARLPIPAEMVTERGEPTPPPQHSGLNRALVGGLLVIFLIVAVAGSFYALSRISSEEGIQLAEPAAGGNDESKSGQAGSDESPSDSNPNPAERNKVRRVVVE